MTTLEILRAARALIAQPGKHCTGHAAADAEGNEVAATAPEARSWCSYGALECLSPFAWHGAASELSITARDLHGKPPSTVNDTTDLPTVLAMFDATIARLEGQG